MSLQSLKLKVSLLISLCLIATSALAEVQEVNLRKGEIAPYDGVLSNYEMYQAQDTLNREFDRNKEELQNCLSSQPKSDPRGFEFYGYVVTFTAGVVAGVGGILFLRQALK